MSKETKIENMEYVKAESPSIDPKEIMKRLNYKPAALVWKNFQNEQPNPDRWVVLWCNLGRISPNLILTYRDATGNYDLPHPTKAYPVQAWAYIDLPEVDQAHLESIQQELTQLAEKSQKEVADAKPKC